MVLKDLEVTIKNMMKYEDPPNFLLIHVAGNDVGNTRVGFLRNKLKDVLVKIQRLLPQTKLIWSQMLPRLKWRYSSNSDSMDRCRARLNSSTGSYIIRKGGHYIKYPDILPNYTFFKDDGVHLTELGNEIFLNTMQGALESFVLYADSTFPNMYKL